MKRKQPGLDILILSILTVITVFTWTGFEVYQALTKSEIPAVLKHQIEPLNPSIKREVLESLKERKGFSVEELIIPPSPTEVTGEEEVATEEAEIEEASPAATATPSAE